MLLVQAYRVYWHIELVSDWLITQLHPPPGTERSWPGPINLTNISGTPMPPFVTTSRMEELVNGSFVHREDDVWVVTYPKSGTTWTISIIGAILGHRNIDPSDLALREFCPWPEFATWKGGPDTVERIAEYPSPRCLKSHGKAIGHLDRGVRQGRVIFVMRNVLDVTVSYFFHNRDFPNIFDYDGQWEEFFGLFTSGNVANGNYFEHLATWWGRRKDPDVLFLRYEEMVADPEGHIERIAAHMGVGSLPDSQVAEVRETTSFQTLHRREQWSLDMMFARLAGWRKYYRLRKGSMVAGFDDGEPRYSLEQCSELERQYEVVLEPLGVPRAWVLGSKAHMECGFTNSTHDAGSRSAVGSRWDLPSTEMSGFDKAGLFEPSSCHAPGDAGKVAGTAPSAMIGC